MPSVLPRISLAPSAVFSQPPACAPTDFGKDAPVQHHGLGNGQFRDAARVGERGVEHRDARVAGGIEIDLIGSDREAADRDQRAHAVERLCVETRARADAHHAGTFERFPERFAFESLGEPLDIGIAGASQRVDRCLRDALEQQNFDFFLGAGKDHVMSPVRC